MSIIYYTSHCNDYYRFDTERRIWEERREMPRASTSDDYTMVELNGMLYVADGARFQCYNPERDCWTAKASSPGAIRSLANSKTIIYGIAWDWTVHQYDAKQDIWTTVHYNMFKDAKRAVSKNYFHLLDWMVWRLWRDHWNYQPQQSDLRAMPR